MPSLLVSHRRPGFYFRVLREGAVRPGDEIVQVAAEHPAISSWTCDLRLDGVPGWFGGVAPSGWGGPLERAVGELVDVPLRVLPTSPAATTPRNKKNTATTTATAGLTNTPTGTLVPPMTAATPLAPILTALTADLFRAGLPGRLTGAATEPGDGARSGPAGMSAVSVARSA